MTMNADDFSIRLQKRHRWQRSVGFSGYPDVLRWEWVVKRPHEGSTRLKTRWAGEANTRRSAIRQARRRIRIETTNDLAAEIIQ